MAAAERRASILAAATRVFAAHGYDAAPVNEIAREAGINVSVVYDHFPSKTSIHAAAIADLGDDLLATQRARIANAAPGREQLHATLDAFFAWAESHPEGVRLLFSAGRASPEAADAHRAFQDRTSRAVLGLLLGLSDEEVGEVDPRLAAVAEFLKGGTDGAIAWWLDHPEVPRAQVVDLLTQLAWAGVSGFAGPPAEGA